MEPIVKSVDELVLSSTRDTSLLQIHAIGCTLTIVICRNAQRSAVNTLSNNIKVYDSAAVYLYM